MKFESLSFKQKIMSNFFIFIALFVLIIVLLLVNQKKLGSLQDEGVSRFNDSEEIARILLDVSAVYAVAADAQINHKLDETKEDLEEIKKKMELNIASVKKIVDTEEEKKWAQEFGKLYQDYVLTFEKELLPELEKSDLITPKTKDLDGRLDALRDETLATLKKISKAIEEEATLADKDFDSTFNQGLLFSLTTSIIVSLLGIFIAFYISNKISSTLAEVNEELLKSYRDIAQNATLLAHTAENLSQSTTEQASAIEETSATIEQMTQMIKKTAESASEANAISKNSASNAHKGKETSEQLIVSVSGIEKNNQLIMNQVTESNQRIGEIVELIKEIGNKTKIINEIVFQTKLLSFNASVEAARAGEQGKGFTVVAAEIGTLAESSGKAAMEISSMLDQSTEKVKRVVAETQSSISEILNNGNTVVRAGLDVANKTVSLLKVIDNDTQTMNHNISEISTASDEQYKGAEQVTLAIHQMNQSTQTNANVSRELHKYSVELTDQTHRLEQAMSNLQMIIKGKA